MTILVLNQAKIVQKLKILPKTRGKISKNLKFPANPLPYVCRKIVQKSLPYFDYCQESSIPEGVQAK